MKPRLRLVRPLRGPRQLPASSLAKSISCPAAAAQKAAPFAPISSATLKRYLRMSSSACTSSIAPFVIDSSKAIVSSDCRSGKAASVPDAIDLVLYHGGGCSDGFGAAFAAWCKLGSRATYLPMEHGPGLVVPDVKGRHVAVVDFCFKADVTHQLVKDAASFIVLDHHASAQADLASVDDRYKVFTMQQSGATLAWDYFHASEPPPFFRYLEDKDLWRWALRGSAEFTAGLGTVPQTFESWAAIVAKGAEGIEELISRGKAIVAYKNGVVESHVKRAVPCRLATAPLFQGMVVNGSTVASEIGNALAKLQGVDYGLVWTYEHASKAFRVSLRSNSDEVDVSLIAKAFGGGGHRRASGFSHTGQSINDLLLTDAPIAPGKEGAINETMKALPSFKIDAEGNV